MEGPAIEKSNATEEVPTRTLEGPRHSHGRDARSGVRDPDKSQFNARLAADGSLKALLEETIRTQGRNGKVEGNTFIVLGRRPGVGRIREGGHWREVDAFKVVLNWMPAAQVYHLCTAYPCRLD